MTVGQCVRVRRFGSTDEWCTCHVELVSPNGLSFGLMVDDGAVYPREGGNDNGLLSRFSDQGKSNRDINSD
jgi:hypothetical protein